MTLNYKPGTPVVIAPEALAYPGESGTLERIDRTDPAQVFVYVRTADGKRAVYHPDLVQVVKPIPAPSPASGYPQPGHTRGAHRGGQVGLEDAGGGRDKPCVTA